MAVAPDAIHRVERAEDVAALPDRRPARRPAGPDHALATATGPASLDAANERFPDLWQPGRSDLCFATTNRQSAPAPDRRPLRRHRGHRLGQLLQHPGPRAAGPRRRLPRVFRVNDPDELPDDLTGTVGVTAGASAPEELVDAVIARLAPTEGIEEVWFTDEDEYFPPPRNLRDLLAAVDEAATVTLGGSLSARPATNDRSIDAADVLAALG